MILTAISFSNRSNVKLLQVGDPLEFEKYMYIADPWSPTYWMWQVHYFYWPFTELLRAPVRMIILVVSAFIRPITSNYMCANKSPWFLSCRTYCFNIGLKLLSAALSACIRIYITIKLFKWLGSVSNSQTFGYSENGCVKLQACDSC